MKTIHKFLIIISFTFLYTLLLLPQDKYISDLEVPISEFIQGIGNVTNQNLLPLTFNSPDTLQVLLTNEAIRSLEQVAFVQGYLGKPPHQKANGVLLGLARNSELNGMIHTVKQMEASFNQNYSYPYLFLNDEPFSDEFKAEIRKLTSATVEFGLIPKEHWSIPNWIDENRFRETLAKEKGNFMYSGLESYRHMCRFNSGFFYKHELIQKYEYYWRIEPNVDYPCVVSYDPFLFMKISGKKYGFNMIASEDWKTVVNLWDETTKFKEKNDITDSPLLSLFGDKEFNGNHYWSNFEIGDLKWFRSAEYNDYFNHLDQSGGFFYSRWGDAPIHSLAVALFLKSYEIHFFGDIGYRHDGRLQCPIKGTVGRLNEQLTCSCDLEKKSDKNIWMYRDWSTPNALDYFTRFNKMREGT